MVIERLSTVNPRFLGRYFSKIRQQAYVPTATSDPDLPGFCWIWTGATDKGPRDTYCYPKIKVNGKTRRTHRWIFSVVIRPLRIDEDAHHGCEVSMCVNPFHLAARPSETHSKRGPPTNWRGDNVVPTDEEIPF